ncbi:leucyl aminopeptidase [Enemella evansiae]|uniref:leucyl aminopeptidase n=1 Tax=Enemella evansiae TaxID=2016499 RepID=UPI001E431AA5|nr:leucyl aminopeptidase [Enemella evansiae]
MVNPVLPQLNAAKAMPADTQVLVIGLTGDGDTPRLVGLPVEVGKAYAKRFGAELATTLVELKASTKVGSTTVVPLGAGLRVVAVGLGKDGEATPGVLRRAAGAAARVAVGFSPTAERARNGASSPSAERARNERVEALRMAVALPTEEPEQLKAVAEGSVLGQYAWAPISAKAEERTAPRITLLTPRADKATKDALTAVGAITWAQLVARDWVNLPANLLYPETFAAEAKELFAGSKVSVEVLDDKQLAAKGYGGLTAVGGGSSHTPRLVRLSYAPRGATAHLALVGKGITFDSGGLNLKPGDSMYTMKCDMGGAAAVFAAVRAIADLGLKVKVTAYGCLAENLPSDTAYRPSDVLTIYGGTTVENYNTDAEGRLVMADGLARSNEDNPDLVVDVATLTGAAMVALGGKIYGVFSDSDEVADRLLGAAETAGEDAWRLPMGEWSAEPLESKVADLRSGGQRMGGASVAASFLRRFVDEGTDWGHLDIAGVGFNEGAPSGEVPAGGTGVGVRTLVELARSMQS